MARAPTLLLPALFALAVVALGTVSHAERKKPVAATTLRVGCFNAWLIPLVSKQRTERRTRMPAALRQLALDVICLQEVWTGGDQRALQKALRKEMPYAVRGGGGLMILSRLPIVDSAWVAFPRYKGLSLPEQLARKGLLEAVIRTPAGRVRVVNSHLALAFGKDNPRRKQLAFLLRRLAKQRDLPLVVAADLNTWPVEGGRLTTDYRALLAAGFADCKPPRKQPDGSYDPGRPTRIGWPRPAVRATKGWYPDHLLTRPGRTHTWRLRRFAFALDVRATALSDHNLLYADLELTPRAPVAPRAKR